MLAPLARTTTMMPIEQMGGAYVRRAFNMGGERRKVGSVITLGELHSLPAANLSAFIKGLWIEPFPKAANASGEPHVVSRGAGRFDVIIGHKVNDGYLTREEADALAAKYQD